MISIKRHLQWLGIPAVFVLLIVSSFFGQAVRIGEKQKKADAIIAEARELARQGLETKMRASLTKFEEARQIYSKIGNKIYEADCLVWLGYVYSSLGDKEEALKYYNQSLPLSRQVGDKIGEAATLNNIGAVYSSLGEKQKALEFYGKALPLSRQVGDGSGEAVTLTGIGAVYSSLGEKQKALEFYGKALPVFKAVGDRSGESATLNNIGVVYHDLGKKQEALKYYNQSLPLRKQVGDRSGEAATLTGIGAVYSSLGEKQKALGFYAKALPLYRAVGDKSGEATTLNNIGIVYYDLGEKQEALKYYNQSLPLVRAVGDRGGEAFTLDWLMIYWKSMNYLRLAVVYGKKSINLYQELRTNIRGLDKQIQKTYLKSVESTYRRLADILIEQGRISEAEQVLAMLKEEEYISYLRRDDKVAADLKGRISLSPAERQAFKDYEKFSGEITRSAQELGTLEKRKNALPLGESLSTEDGRQYDELKAKYDAAVTVFSKYLDDLKVKFAQKGEQYKQVAAVESDTQGLLKKLKQPHTVIISTIVGEDRLNLIVTTSDIQKAYTVDVRAADLNKLVAEFRAVVKTPRVEPRPLGKKLYDKLFPAALEKDLKNIKADTIVWSLDGTLRYLPMAALWDGEKYLVERYRNSVLTLASRDKLDAAANADRQKWLAFGVGVSKPFEDFKALPAVPQELCSVVNDPEKKEFCRSFGETGVFSGLMLPDEEFTLAGFQNNLGKTAIVHIASHFSLNAGNETDSYLLLGGGENRRFSLDALKKTRLDNIELLTLSACNTAMSSGNNSTGVEIEGFGALAQKQGAKTVLATLWAVADDSTGELMTGFYRILETNPEIGKAEAIRMAQLKLIQGKYKTINQAQTMRSDKITLDGESSDQPKFIRDENAPYAHPYYWSPFVLIGNWR